MTTPSPAAEQALLGEANRRTARSFCAVAFGFWRGPSARRAWLLVLTVAGAVAMSVVSSLSINIWNRWFFDALERREAAELSLIVAVFPVLLVAGAAIAVWQIIARETLQVRWREWLTGRLEAIWLANRRFYRLGFVDNAPDNPEYRIGEDSRWATEPVVDLAIGFFSATLSAITFIGILWTVGGTLRLDVGATTVAIPAYMVIAAVLYGITGSTLIMIIGRSLPYRLAERNEREARYRFEMMRLRENAESIAMVRGEEDERANLRRTYATLLQRWLAVVRQHGRITWIINGNAVLGVVFPLLLATPKYLAGELTLGAVIQLGAAFVQVQTALNWLVDNYSRLSEWFASAKRVTDLVDALEELDAEPASGAQCGIVVEASPDAGLHVRDLSVVSHKGQTLLAGLDLSVRPGEWVLVTGESGVGKSTLLRAIAGMCAAGSGRVQLPGEASFAFVPQRPYLPMATLRAAMLYPSTAADVSDARLLEALNRCGLDHLAARLDEVARWDQALSNGDRQRLAFARLFVERPDVILMDETTAGAGDAGYAELLARLRDELPRSIVIMVGPQSMLETRYDQVVILQAGPHGTRCIVERRPAGSYAQTWTPARRPQRSLIEREHAGVLR